MNSIIENTLPFCKERFTKNGVKLKLDCPQDVSIPCRSIQISQILLNLLNNSHDAIGNLDEKWIKITVSELEENVEIIVSDSGPGLSEEVQNKLFQPFYTTKGNAGTGLGLSISLGLANSHGGSLTYRKAENTSFALILPKMASRFSIKKC